MTETRSCQNCKNSFTIEPDDFSFYEKIKVPPTTFCPQCRLIRRLARRNERTFYRRECEKCHKQIITVLSPESGLINYCSECWWSDSWDGLDYPYTFDESKPILAQLQALFKTVPAMNLYGLYSTKINSEYTNMASWLKNCYLVTYSDYCENITYGSFINHSKDSVDNLMGNQLELCYQTINCNQCYRTFYSVDCESCTDVWFSKNCSGCNNCFGCVNLKKQSYHIFNQPYDKDSYEKKVRELFDCSSESIAKIQADAKTFWRDFPQKYTHGWRNIESTGDYLNDTKNAKNCFIGFEMEDCRYCSFVTGKITDTYDFANFGANSSLMYEVFQGGDQTSNIRMCQWAITNCRNLEYCLFCTSCQDCFACVGLNKRQYCIFNIQYTKEEYANLRQKFVNHMNEIPYIDSAGLIYKYGEFFPIEFSPFAYNETTAQELFPLTKAEALMKGYRWYEDAKRNYQTTIEARNLPKTIAEVSDSIVNEVIACDHGGTCNEQCATAFKIIPAELQFYRQMNLPLPRLCPNCRHAARLKYRNPMQLWQRTCDCKKDHPHHIGACTNTFKTSYSPDSPEKVYCEHCYQQEVS